MSTTAARSLALTRCTVFVGWIFATVQFGFAQTASPPAATSASDTTVILSPFEVTTTKDVGYTAANTLAGSRLNTELWDTPAAISVFTAQFLEDTGVLDVKSALDYAMNTSEDTTDYTGNNLAANDINLQVRGFTGATVGRNYFEWALSSDRFNIERIDMSRGPNSVLFGIGAPGGIINTSTKRARIGRDVLQLRTRFGSWEDYRAEIDYGKTFVPGKLAARVNLMYQDKNDWREFKGSERAGAALALTYRPFKHTEIRFDGEYGDVNQVIAAPWPANEIYLSWENAGRPISQSWGQAVPGTGVNNSLQLIWDPYAGTGPVSWRGSRVSNGGPQATALANLRTAILDESIHPRWAAISGPGWTADFHFFNYAAFVEQRVGENLAFEAAFNRQHLNRFQHRPQGFSQVAFRGDPNALMPTRSDGAGTPTAFAANPNVGKFYTEGLSDLRLITSDRTIDDFRLTSSYRLDLTPRHKWLGRHDLAALASRTNSYNRDDQLLYRNITPAGTATYPLDVTAGNNLIILRNHIDFSRPEPRWHGLFDIRDHPLNGQNGVTGALVRSGDVGRDTLTRTDTKMAATQSRWLDGRLVLTGGLRQDRERVWEDSVDFDNDGDINEHREPVSRLLPRRQRTDRKMGSVGDTKTFGIVVHPLQWLAVFYNQSDSFRPQNAQDLHGNLVGNRKGLGEDMGVRLRLWDGRINATIARYTTDDTNEVVQIDNNFMNYMNSIWRALGQPNNQVLTSARDSQALSGEGWEFELTANPTRHWRVSANLAQTEQVASELRPRYGAYLESNRAAWLQRGTTPLGGEIAAGIPTTDPVTGGPATVATALRSVDAIYAAATAGAGSIRRQLREYTGNVFTTYSFRSRDTWLRGLSLGGGAQYRGRPVIGYDATRNNRPLYGDAYTLASAMLAYEWRLRQGRSLKIQLNVDNLFDEDDPIVTDANESQEFRYVFQTPRRFGVTTTLTF